MELDSVQASWNWSTTFCHSMMRPCTQVTAELCATEGTLCNACYMYLLCSFPHHSICLNCERLRFLQGFMVCCRVAASSSSPHHQQWLHGRRRSFVIKSKKYSNALHEKTIFTSICINAHRLVGLQDRKNCAAVIFSCCKSLPNLSNAPLPKPSKYTSKLSNVSGTLHQLNRPNTFGNQFVRHCRLPQPNRWNPIWAQTPTLKLPLLGKYEKLMG